MDNSAFKGTSGNGVGATVGVDGDGVPTEVAGVADGAGIGAGCDVGLGIEMVGD